MGGARISRIRTVGKPEEIARAVAGWDERIGVPGMET
jgi:hypothetical protein